MGHPEVEMATVSWVGISLVVLTCWVGVARGQALKPSGSKPDPSQFCPGDVLHERVSSGTVAGQLISRPDPIFPPEAAVEPVSGAVVLRVCIGADGHVEKAEPISGPEMLRKAYVDAVSRWVYRPYLLNGVAVPVMTTVTANVLMGASSTDDGFCGSARPGDPDYPVWVSSGTMAGQLISRPDPVYPPLPRDAHVSGGSVMRVCIGRDGRVKKIVAISGPEVLRKPLMDAVSGWVYRPYLVDGKPVPVVTTVTVYISFGGG